MIGIPVIDSLNATNASFVIQYGKYIDYNIWITMFIITIVLVLISRLLPERDDVGKFLISVFSVIISIAVIWGSLGVAHLDYVSGATATVNNVTLVNGTESSNSYVNTSIQRDYVYPVQRVVASPWMTFISVILLIVSVLNTVDIVLVMLQRPSEEENQRKGRGLRI